jgi:hypothetical protein
MVEVMKPWAALALVAAISCYACGSSTSAPSTSTSGTQTITTSENLHWNQVALSDAEMASIRFAIYVDGTRSELAGAQCAASSSEGTYACSSPLPPLTTGSHTLQLASYYVGFENLESRAPAMTVVVAGTEP